MRVVVVGAGPVGLSAAFGALARGHEVTVLDKGEVGESLRRWGATTFFTPFGMNLPTALRGRLADAPGEDAHLTGPELAERVLVPLAAQLDGRVRTGCRVVCVRRARMCRGELAGHPLRAERPFHVLVDGPRGEEVLEADRVIDASGCYDVPAPLGVPGERALAGQLIRDLGTLAQRSVHLVGRRVLLLGHGHSAANALGVLDELARAYPGTSIVWAVRSPNLRPCVEVAGDPLPERRMVVSRANELAQRPPPHVRVERRASVESLAEADGALRVALSGGRVVDADAVVALTGYRPDWSFASELPLALGAATEGVARLERALANVTDCLSLPKVAAADLQTGEPGYHVAGAKSYGRARTFLLQTGYQQLETILDAL